MNYFILAGEPSGDLHGSNLVKQLLLQDANAKITAWGGDHMHNAGAHIVKHINELSFLGIVEVAKNLSTILANFSECKKAITSYNSEVLILIDYPSFNLRMAKWAKQKGLKVIYYISPKVWAWKESRVKSIRKYVDKLICILPFEPNYYKNKWNMEVDYVGNPLMDEIIAFKNTHAHIEKKPKQIALLPGSRVQEITKILPKMLAIVDFYSDYTFVVAKAPNLASSLYEPILKNSRATLATCSTYELLQTSEAAIVASGTATLETGIFKVPQIVCYQANALSVWIAKKLVNIKFVSLINLIAQKEVVKELIQSDFNIVNMKQELDYILYNNAKKEMILQEYDKIIATLGDGHASQKAAQLIIDFTA